MNSIPSKQDCHYIIVMLESFLIDYQDTQPWADKLIEDIDIPPAWLCEVSINKYQDDQINAFREYVYSEPFEEKPDDLDKFYVACLWIRYERQDISWATFLWEIGDYLDAAQGEWDCETPYHYLNLYENASCSKEAEEETKKQYLTKQNIMPWLEVVRSKFQWFQIQ